MLAAWAEAVATAVTTSRSTSEVRARAERSRSLARSTGLLTADEVVRSRLAERRPSVASGRLVIRCLGAFAIERDGEAVALPPLRPLPRALMLLLALHHRATSTAR